MKLLHNIHIAIIAFLVSFVVFGFALFEYQLSKVSNDTTKKEITIEQGSITKIAKTLHKEGLIRNVFAFKVYCKISKKTSLKAATYYFSPNMGTKKIIKELYKGNGKNNKEIKITFKEGFNTHKLIKTLKENTNIKEEEIINTLKDQEYLKTLIDKYWFLTEDILNDKIYYSLEGYLYPNTYFFTSKNIEIKEVLDKLLTETDKQLTPYKEKINSNSLSIHKIITLASIVELEGLSLEDRKGIAGVFMNRLEKNISLGSDVTTYYGANIDMGERDLTSKEVKECNNYNTRCTTFQGLPVSPIDNPSKEAIEAVLDYQKNDYYYFVADKNKKIYFSKNITEHNNTINKLKKQGLWFEY